MSAKHGAALDRATLRAIPRPIWALGFVSLLMDASSEMIHALLPVFLVSALGASPLTVGIIEGLGEATASVTKVFSGAISDWIGRRKLLAALGYGLAALSKPLFALAPDPAWVLAARLIDRVGKGVRGAPRDALIAELAPRRLRGASFGLRQALDTVGAFAGPVIAIVLMAATGDSFRVVFWIAVIPALFAVALIVLGVREPEDAAGPRAAPPRFGGETLAWLGRPYWTVVAIGVVFSLAQFSAAFLILKARAAGLPIALAPLVFILMNIVYALGAYPAGVLSDRGGRAPMLAVGLILLALGDIALAFSSSLAGVAIGVALWGLQLAFTQGVLSAMVADHAPNDLRGTAFGVFNFATGLALLVASAVAGGLWDVFGPTATFLTGATLAVVTLIGLTATRGRGGGAA